MFKNKQLIKIILFVIFVIVIAILMRVYNITSIDELIFIINNNKQIAPIVYMVLFSILPTFFVPVTILAICAGAVFGLVYASIYTYIGAFINTSITYFISKYLAYDYVKSIIEEKHKNLYDKLKNRTEGKEGFILMLTLRLLPFFPYTLLNYASGVVGYDYKIFILSTMIGILPGMLCYVNIGANSVNGWSKELFIAISIFLTFSISTSYIAKKYFSDKK